MKNKKYDFRTEYLNGRIQRNKRTRNKEVGRLLDKIPMSIIQDGKKNGNLVLKISTYLLENKSEEYELEDFLHNYKVYTFNDLKNLIEKELM